MRHAAGTLLIRQQHIRLEFFSHGYELDLHIYGQLLQRCCFTGTA